MSKKWKERIFAWIKKIFLKWKCYLLASCSHISMKEKKNKKKSVNNMRIKIEEKE